MNKITLIVSAVFASAVFAGTANAASCDKCATGSTSVQMPVPVHVVSVTNLPTTFEAGTVELALTIDEQGVPQRVKPMQNLSAEVKSSVVSAVSQWRFTPKYVDGKPVKAQVILPLQITDKA